MAAGDDKIRCTITWPTGATFEGFFEWPSIPAMVIEALEGGGGSFVRGVDLLGKEQWVNIVTAATIELET